MFVKYYAMFVQVNSNENKNFLKNETKKQMSLILRRKVFVFHIDNFQILLNFYKQFHHRKIILLHRIYI